jgi:hypothetical protein
MSRNTIVVLIYHRHKLLDPVNKDMMAKCPHSKLSKLKVSANNIPGIIDDVKTVKNNVLSLVTYLLIMENTTCSWSFI